MAALLFALEELPEEPEVEALPRVQIDRLTVDRRTKGGRYSPEPGAAAYRGPTADNWEFRLVHVAKGERTCLGCGETFSRGICPRCGLPEPGEKGGKRRADRLPPTVLTESYLRPEEYRLLGV